jgi:ribosomal-protein-alanine N-acetyltransferase
MHLDGGDVMNKPSLLVESRPVASGTLERTAYAPDWRDALPTLSSGQVVLREVRASDAHSLQSFLTTPEVTRFISAPPSTVDGFERFIQSSRVARADGRGACFAITLRDSDVAIGLVQVRQIRPAGDDPLPIGESVHTAEWGFAIGSPFWAMGIFPRTAALAIQFAFEHVQVHRLEARCAVQNARGRLALQKVGATPEGILRNAFLCRGEYLDQVLYTISEDDWQACRDRAQAVAVVRVH